MWCDCVSVSKCVCMRVSACVRVCVPIRVCVALCTTLDRHVQEYEAEFKPSLWVTDSVHFSS